MNATATVGQKAGCATVPVRFTNSVWPPRLASRNNETARKKIAKTRSPGLRYRLNKSRNALMRDIVPPRRDSHGVNCRGQSTGPDRSGDRLSGEHLFDGRKRCNPDPRLDRIGRQADAATADGRRFHRFLP